MPETNQNLNPTDPTTPFLPRQEGAVVDSEYLIRQAFAMDTRRGYEFLFRRYYKVLCNQAVRFTYARDVAEDIVADVFSEDPQSIIQCTELYQRLEREIKLLPPQCQRVFVLSRFDGKKQREIADELQISLKAVEGHIQRALLQLRRVVHVGLLILANQLTGEVG